MSGVADQPAHRRAERSRRRFREQHQDARRREGVRTFEAGLPAPLTLIEQRRLEGSDITLLRYACTAGARLPNL